MRHLHLDLLGGLAGDMFLASLLDAGVLEVEELREVLGGLGLGPVEVRLEPGRRGALAGRHLSFGGWDPAHDTKHRHLSTILGILESSDLAPSVQRRASAMFTVLGEAEAKVHGMPLEKVHFHECGAMDSILDFVGAAWALEHLGATWSTGPIPTGRGTTLTDHGVVPIPVPATVELLRGFTLEPRDVEVEMVTPTGATLLRALDGDDLRRPQPAGRCLAVGYGLGSREVPGIANAVRCMVFEAAEPRAEGDRPQAQDRYRTDEVCRLSCDIDDMNPELLPGVERELLDAGALDVSREALWMKKGRQGTRLTVLCRPEDRMRVADLIFTGTTTFGLRTERVERLVLRREMDAVDTEWGRIEVKLGFRGDVLLKAAPEIESCLRVAETREASVEEVYAQACDLARRRWRRR
ncbi:MAG: LarC family nickel insertion protein [Acidobacteriota bacterium]